MVRMSREAAKARTRERLIGHACRLFGEQGYSATSLEQIAEAAELTKGAIYGHFASKEDLLLSAIEGEATPDYSTLLNDSSRPIRDRLAEFGRSMASEAGAGAGAGDGATGDGAGDAAGLAVKLEFVAALLRNPAAMARFSADFERRLTELAGQDVDEPAAGTSTLEAWAIGYALGLGLQISRAISPGILTADVCARAYELLAGLYADPDAVATEPARRT